MFRRVRVYSNQNKWLSLSSVVIIAAAVAFVSSLFGFNNDHAIAYETGLRLLAGQVLYRDFYVPQGPLTGLFLLPFLRVAPTGGLGYALASAVLNALAALAVWFIVFKATARHAYALLSGLLTAVWFLPVMGGLYCDHLSYAVALLAFAGFVELGWSWKGTATAGILFALSYYAKQNIGLCSAAAFVVAAIAAEGRQSLSPRKLGRVFGVYVVSHLVLLGLIAACTDIENFYHYSVSGPLTYALHSSDKQFLRLLEFLAIPWQVSPQGAIFGSGWARLAFFPVVVAVYVAYFVLLRLLTRKLILKHEERQRTVGGIAFLLFSTLLCSALAGRWYGHLFFGMGGVLSLCFFCLAIDRWHLNVKLQTVFGVGFLMLGIAFVAKGRLAGWAADEFFADTDLYPLRIERNEISAASQQVIRFLRGKNSPVAMLGHGTYLVGPALRRAPVNFTLYYDPYLTVPPLKSAYLERWRRWRRLSLRALNEKKAQYVVRKRGNRYLTQFVDERFTVALEAPPLEVLERR